MEMEVGFLSGEEYVQEKWFACDDTELCPRSLNRAPAPKPRFTGQHRGDSYSLVLDTRAMERLLMHKPRLLCVLHSRDQEAAASTVEIDPP